MRRPPHPLSWPVSEVAGVVGFVVGVAVVYVFSRSLLTSLIGGTLLGGAGALLRHRGAALAYLGLVLVGSIMLLAWAVLRPAADGRAGTAPGPRDFRVERIRFFESGPQHPALDARDYARSFDARTARYVCWQLDASFGELPRRTPIRIDYVYYDPDGNELGRAAHATHLEAGWVESWHSRCWGWDEAGRWRVGNYRVHLMLDGEALIKGAFAIH